MENIENTQPEPVVEVDPAPAPAQDAEEPQSENPSPPELGTYELLRCPDAADPVTPPDDDVTAFVLSRTRRSVWD